MILIVMLGFGLMMIFTNKKSNIVDERDILNQKKATSVGMMLTGILVFLITIFLFIQNEDICL